MSGRLVIMGSGENAPGMVKLHRTLFANLGDGAKMMLDTPFGFQVNADDLSSKYQQYFDESVGQTIEIGKWRRKDDPVLDRERTLALINRSDWVFAGPGSPSYALQHWQDTPIPGALAEVLTRNGTLVIGSAAAATIGSYAIPVYEIYKVGLDPYWLHGLNLLGTATGIQAVVVPHFDNREGGRHDTSCCYIGLERLKTLEALLPAGIGVIGVDEHTAVVMDLNTDEISVYGPGGLTLRNRDELEFIAAGSTTTVDHVRHFFKNQPVNVAEAPESTATSSNDPAQRFAALLTEGDTDGAAAIALEVESELFSTTSIQAHEALRSMLVQLADTARNGLVDTRVVLEPLVNIALEVRRLARENKDYAMSDLVRDSLTDAGIEVRDTPDGMVWEQLGKH
ncbi:MAG: hypothetical protein Q8L05_10780 [Actinomycetota bacterium]|nr:hypothetical protein [Actinomycetota bacterium]MDP2287382.1 hypothetical protein [Actinomycetota bacterium]